MRDDTNPSGWVIGGVFFAGVLMVIAENLPVHQRIGGDRQGQDLRRHPGLRVRVRRDHLGMDPPDHWRDRRPSRNRCDERATWARVVGIVLAGSRPSRTAVHPVLPILVAGCDRTHAIWIIWALCDERAGARSRY